MKRFLVLFMVFLMIFTTVSCNSNKNQNETTTQTQELTEETTAPTSNEPAKEIPKEVSNEITVNFHYLRDDANYEGWNLWVWAEGADGASYTFDPNKADDKGVTSTVKIPSAASNIGFIVRLNEWEDKDTANDRFIDVSEVVTGNIDIYITTGKEEFETVFGSDVVKGIKVVSAVLNDNLSTIYVETTSDITTDPKETLVLVNQDNEIIELSDISFEGKKGTLNLKQPVDASKTYYLVINSQFKHRVNAPSVFSTSAFESEFTYTGNDLGATWSKDKTTFKVWAPTATAVKLNLYKSGDENVSDLVETIDMKSDVNGTWMVDKAGDLNKTYYTYTVNVNGTENEACDPYAKATGVNGNRAMVIDLSSTNPTGWNEDKNPHTGENITDAVIYELHVRDLSSDQSSGIKNVGKYLGLTEKGTKNASGDKTGLDHMIDLGITHLHLNPVYDYQTVDETKLSESQFNWGYDPKNYNTPEGSYSTDPYNGEVRIEEFKEMVQTLHKNDISVIMDVVYNHTYNSDFCFNKIVPEYFFRINQDGKFSNGSGCGNDVASERTMVSKFIVDSVAYWAKEYHIDGFRFDLVGLTDVDTINAIRKELDKIDPSIIMYGEGWTMKTETTKANVVLATQPNTKKVPGMAMFNDNIRDAIKGSVFDGADKGYVNGASYSKSRDIKSGVLGLPIWSPSPTQVINYTSCHDNLTLWDKINSSNGDDSLEDRIKQNLLAASIVYTSQGTPFILAGEEMLRTKVKPDGTFDHNSYASSDEINSIKWNTMSEPENKKVIDFYKGLIAFRKAHTSLRMTENTSENIVFEKEVPDGVVAYTINKVAGEVSDGIFVIYNPLRTSVTINLPDGEWNICVNGNISGTDVIKTVSGSVDVDSISCMVLVKGAVK